MYPILPVFIPAYFNFKKSQSSLTSARCFQHFFLSWEDALWYLLQVHDITTNSKILVPDFFCADVVVNMRTHGLEETTYIVNKNLQPDLQDFKKKLQEEKPKIVVIFHAVGITNSLMQNFDEWAHFLSTETIIIEDCVHRIIDPEQIHFFTKNHYLIDSLRKVVPLQGSWLYSERQLKRLNEVPSISTFLYTQTVFFWWILLQIFSIVVYYSKSKDIKRVCNLLSEYAMQRGYDVIGDNILPSRGISFMRWLAKKIDTKKIYEKKIEQVTLYKRLLGQLIENEKNKNTKRFFDIPFSESDYSQLRGYPLGVEMAFSNVFLRIMRNNGFLIRFEQEDSAWSSRQKVVFLPLGIHISLNDIHAVCKLIISFSI